MREEVIVKGRGNRTSIKGDMEQAGLNGVGMRGQDRGRNAREEKLTLKAF